MDCQALKELLDAYALGAVEEAQARALEEHAAACIRCWNELNQAQRAAALLALAVPLEKAHPSLRERILRQAGREVKAGPRRWQGWLGKVWPLWPAAVIGLAAVAALSLSLVLWGEVRDLRGENDRLQERVATADETISHQQRMLAVLSAPDVQRVEMRAPGGPPGMVATYFWSESTHRGAIICHNLGSLDENHTYQLWLFVGDSPISGGTFVSWWGLGQHVVELEQPLPAQPTAVGVSIEPKGGSATPTSDLILLASLPQE